MDRCGAGGRQAVAFAAPREAAEKPGRDSLLDFGRPYRAFGLGIWLFPGLQPRPPQRARISSRAILVPSLRELLPLRGWNPRLPPSQVFRSGFAARMDSCRLKRRSAVDASMHLKQPQSRMKDRCTQGDEKTTADSSSLRSVGMTALWMRQGSAAEVFSGQILHYVQDDSEFLVMNLRDRTLEREPQR